MTTSSQPSGKYPQSIVSAEDLEIAATLHRFVDEQVMPRRRDLEGGPDRDPALAHETIENLLRGLIRLDIQRAFFPERIGGLGLTPA